MTHKDIVAGTGLAPRTVRYALKRLKEQGLILEKFNFRDARQVNYEPKSVPVLAPVFV
jgi:DNA-binding transcriptional ArsR family regulator